MPGLASFSTWLRWVLIQTKMEPRLSANSVQGGATGAGQHSVLWQYGVCSGKIDHRDFSCHALLRELGRGEKSLSI